MSVITWRKSSGVPLQATRVHRSQDKRTAAEKSINESVMCRAGSNKRAPVSPLYTTFRIILTRSPYLGACNCTVLYYN